MVATGTLLLSSLLAELASLGNFLLAITCIIAPLLGVILNSGWFSGPPQFISRNIMLCFCVHRCRLQHIHRFCRRVPLFGSSRSSYLRLFLALLFSKAFSVPLWATLIGLNASAGGPATAFVWQHQRMESSSAACRARRYIGYAIGTLVGCLMSEFLRVFAPL